MRRYAEAVRADERDASRLGINAVPYFVVDRTYGVPGAQPTTELRAALDQVWAESPAGTEAGR